MREAITSLSDAEIEALGFGDLVSLCRDAGVREIEMLEDRGRTCTPQVELEDRLDGDTLDELECVDDWELVAEKPETYRYVLELTATALPESADRDHDELTGHCEPTVTDRGMLLSLVGDQEAIRDMLRNYEAVGVTPELHKLGEYDGDSTTFDALTDRQFEVITTAYELGFYEVPREGSTEDIAEELDLDPATVSEHLQRAERNILTEELAP